MKIVSWNCDGGFSDKFDNLIKIKADLYLVQEVNERKKNNWINNPKFPINNYLYLRKTNGKYHDYKGVLAFSYSKHRIKINRHLNDLNMRYYQYFNFNHFRILNVWTHPNYIENLVSILLSNEKELFKNNHLLIMGDFNSNVIWNYKHKFSNQNNFNDITRRHGIVSAYHLVNKESFGNEHDFTFRMYKHFNQKYHMDYAYAAKDKIVDFKINHSLDEISDHSVLQIILKF
ncbi:hypothetical protein WR164_15150 [Philodulcilactobacillus myokoensis]|uniref:Endonuclease/exonuclease/phosphatase domain-containing protein n=1 Tax=Philodulcilactobacillus myokoensis TaxID=2929573 RepID=A0A9W6B3A0_9LACO|nr:endonuclease/exonuclease/phosphatase family protein [Philodulcilactobacillus myokoensis]GLB47536.1 hypothetical protein WR164_15150 [Philodulcilactobacillus myokoensis]